LAALDIDALLQGISPEAPCGEDLEYDPAFIAVEQKAKGTPEKQIGDRIEPPQPPNWKEVRGDVLELLGRTLDLRLLLELIRANLALDGVAGLKEGTALLRAALEAYWDGLHPRLDPDDDNDPTARVNILEGLCDADSVLRMLFNAPLVESRVLGRFSLRDMQIAAGKLSPPAEGEAPPLATIQAAFSDVEPERLQETQAALDACLDNAEAIERLVGEQVGVGNAPNLGPFRAMLKEALHILDEQMARRGLAEVETEEIGDEASPAADRVGAAPQPQGHVGGVNNRQDVMRLLDLICEYYAKSEPSSPVPLLMRRAKRLVPMDFMEIMNDLAPDGLNQVGLIIGHGANETSETNESAED